MSGHSIVDVTPDGVIRVRALTVRELQRLADQRRLVVLDQPLPIVGDDEIMLSFPELDEVRDLIQLDDQPLDGGWNTQPMGWDM